MIREAVPEDAPLLALLLREAFEEYRGRLTVRLALQEHQAWYARLGYTFLAHGAHAGYRSPTFVVLQKRP